MRKLALFTALLAPTAFAAPPAWVVTDADSRLVLFPTVHALQDGLDWQTDTLNAEIASAGEVWTEIGRSDTPEVNATIQALVAERGMSPDIPLPERLTEEQYAAVSEAMETLGLPEGALDGLQPWMAALALAQTALTASGISGDNGVEAVLETTFAGRELRGLETASTQVALLADLDPELQVQFLMEAVDGAGDIGETLRRVSEAWTLGDTSILEDELLAEMRASYAEVFKIVFTDRNAAWTEILSKELEGSGTDFVAVGAGHLVGEDSVPAMLRARGYTVERLSLAD